MGQYSAYSVHRRVDYAQYTYRNADKYAAFDDLQFPIAAYDRDGIIRGANRYFRNITGISDDVIQHEQVNIFELFNEKSAVLIEAAHNVFNGEEKAYEDIGRVLHAEPGTIEYLKLADYPNAIFFPMTFNSDGVKLGAVLLDRKETEAPEKDDESDYVLCGKVKKNFFTVSATRLITIAAACMAVFIIGFIAFNLAGKPLGVGLQDGQVPLGELPFMQTDESAKPNTGAEQGYIIPGIESVAIPADTAAVQIILLNPADSDSNLAFEIVIDGETLYQSGLVEPGMCIEGITLSKGLPGGEYKAVLNIRCYAPEDLIETRGTSVDFALIVD